MKWLINKFNRYFEFQNFLKVSILNSIHTIQNQTFIYAIYEIKVVYYTKFNHCGQLIIILCSFLVFIIQISSINNGQWPVLNSRSSYTILFTCFYDKILFQHIYIYSINILFCTNVLNKIFKFKIQKILNMILFFIIINKFNFINDTACLLYSKLLR